MNNMTQKPVIDTAKPDYEYLTPEELLAEYVSGDDGAFTALVEVIGTRLLGFIHRFIGDFHIAEDVFQTVLLKLATHAAAFNNRANLNTWVFAIARNASIDALKAHNKIRLILNDPAESQDKEDEIDQRISHILCNSLPPLQQLTVEELGRRISAAVTALPEKQREVFLLREDADLSIEEIAKIVECSRETAKSRLRYAVNKLRINLKKEARLYGLLDRL